MFPLLGTVTGFPDTISIIVGNYTSSRASICHPDRLPQSCKRELQLKHSNFMTLVSLHKASPHDVLGNFCVFLSLASLSPLSAFLVIVRWLQAPRPCFPYTNSCPLSSCSHRSHWSLHSVLEGYMLLRDQYCPPMHPHSPTARPNILSHLEQSLLLRIRPQK